MKDQKPNPKNDRKVDDNQTNPSAIQPDIDEKAGVDKKPEKHFDTLDPASDLTKREAEIIHKVIEEIKEEKKEEKEKERDPDEKPVGNKSIDTDSPL